MAWVEAVSGQFFVLIILSLVWLTFRFALDSAGFRPDDEHEPMSRRELTGWCIGWTAICCLCLTAFVNDWTDPNRDWKMIGLSAI